MNDGIGNDNYLTELDIRVWARDNNPDANILLLDYEFGSEEIRTAMTLTVDKWNETPPDLGRPYSYDVSNFPYRGELLRGTVANLLFIAAMGYRRNALPVKTPGGIVNDQDKYQQYDAAGARMWDEYVRWVNRKKHSINMEIGWAVIR